MKKLLLTIGIVLISFVVSAADACVPCKIIQVGKKIIFVLMSYDPNEMAGPAGVGEQRYVKPGETMDYTIYFENQTNATAAAIKIAVTLPKDANLDWSTLELGEVVFGDHTDTGFVDDKTTRSIKYALADSGCEVRTAVTETDSDITWNLRIWNPTTDDHFPDDFKLGVLPPNDETGRGEGHLRYRVKVKDNAMPGNKINASASIVFDDNPAIETDPAWWNTVAEMAAVKMTVDGVERTLDLIVGLPYGELPTPAARAGYAFGGWFTGPNGTGRRVMADTLVEAGDSGLYAHWIAETPPATVDDNNIEEETKQPVFILHSVDVAAPSAPVVTATAEYAGYLKDAKGKVAGSIQLKLAKAGKDGTSKVTGTVQLGPKKEKVTGTYKDGVLTAAGFSNVTLDKNGITATYKTYSVDGARNVFAAKDAASKNQASAAMKAYKGAYTVAWQDGGVWGGVTVTVGNKGKAKVTGFLPNGTKVGADGQLMLGDGAACMTLVSKNKKTPLAFNLWLTGGAAVVDGLGSDTQAAKVGALASGKSFTCSLLGNPVPVTVAGKKWSITTDKATALKLTFTAKAGSFKGSFKAGKQKATVNGVVVNGLGYGSAVIKKGAKAAVTIE